MTRRYQRLVNMSLAAVLLVLLVWIGYTEVRQGVAGGPPVYVVVFDEFSTGVLLDATKRVDNTLFPNYAELAGSSYWYRNATTVSPETQFGMPAILTGRYPELQDVRMKYEYYPDNICTLFFEAGWRVHSLEAGTALCGREDGAKVSRVPVWLAKALSVFDGKFDDDRAQRFKRWLEDSRGEAGNLNLIVSLLPHSPYEYRPDGEKHTEHAIFDFESSDKEAVWQDEVRARAAYEQYVWQVQYTDRLLGELIDFLEEQGLYDEALVVVTADHGVTYRLGANRRFPLVDEEGKLVDEAAAADLVKVPMLIKLPGQTEGVVVDGPATTVDLLPTIFSYLGILPERRVDGRDLLGTSRGAEHSYVLLGRTYRDRTRLRQMEHRLDIMSDAYNPIPW